jgi:fatty-acyl-CoA synthase
VPASPATQTATIHHAFFAAAAALPSALAVREDQGEVSFGELADTVRRISGWLAGRVSPGGRVAIAMEPSACYLAVVLGAAAAGVTAAPLNTRLTAVETARYLQLLDPQLCIADSVYASLVPDSHVLDRPAHPETLADRLRPVLAEPAGIRDAAGGAALVLPTGGTTGTPKAVQLSHASVWSQAMNAAVSWRRVHGDTELWYAPLYHLGLVVCPLATLIAGASCMILPGFDPDRVVEAISGGEVTHISGPFTVHRTVWDHPRFSPAATGRVRRVMIGGSAATAEVLDRLLECYPGAQLVHGYASTESGVVSQLTAEHLALGRRTGVGHAVPGACVEIVDRDGNTVPRGTEGLVVAVTPWAADGYLGNPDATSATFRPDGVCVGDVGVLDEDGWLTLRGRDNDMIKTGGENVFPLEVEQALDRHPAVDVSVAYGVPDDTWGERVEAAVLVRGGTEVTGHELRAFLRPVLGSYKIPKVFRRLASIPMTPNNKPDRRALRAAALAQDSANSI